jgi:PAS domain S-box-containing protein
LSQTIDKIKDYDFLRAIITNLPAVAFVVAPDGTVLFAEGKGLAFAGLTRDEFLGAHASEFFHLYPELEGTLHRVLEGETITSRAIAPSQRSFEVTYSPMRNDRGSICGVIGVAQDITERIEQEQALQDSEEKFRSITSAAIDAIIMMDQTGRISLWNESAQAIFGYTEREAIGQDLHLLIASQRYPDQIMMENFASRGKGPLFGTVLELTAKRKSGEEFPLELSLSAFRLHDQWHAVGTARDITERKKAEEALQDSERRLSSIYDTVGDIIFHLAVETGGSYRFISVNQAFCSVTGLSKEMIVGKLVSEVIPEPSFSVALGKYQQAIRENSVIRWEEISDYPTGQLTGEVSIVPVVDDEGRCTHLVGSVHDITERKRAAEALRESEEKFRRIFDEGPFGMMMAGRDFRFMRVNAAFCRMVGYSASELASLTFKDITHPDHLSVDSEFVMQVFSGEIPRYSTEKRYIRKDKETVWGALTLSAIRSNGGQFLYCLGIIEDITERKRAEEERERLQQQLQQSQKLEAIGTMAGGIAHDFNNILTGILGFTELVRSEVPENSEAYENLAEVLNAGHRARDLVKQILSFSRRAETEKCLISLVTIVKDALKLIRNVTPAHISIKQNFTASPARAILADAIQMHQVVLNLCINAADAMPDGGVLDISLKEMRVEPESQLTQTQLPSGCYLKLTVRDNGTGMSPEVRERIFEPYFTTKLVGKGTGMGLAVVHGVVKEHGGSITVFSDPGKGTTFEICLPIVEATPDTENVSVPTVATGNESILFVDDETMITNLQRSQLGKWGYRVTATENSATALGIFRTSPRDFDLVITDQSMPYLTGVKLAQAIHEISPSTPIILCTGFDEGISPENADAIGIHAILTKPITGAEFSRSIRMVLDETSKPSQAKS